MGTTTLLASLIAFIFNYLVLYKKNRILGNIGYMVAGLIIYMSASSNSERGLAIFLVAGSIMAGIYDFIIKTDPKNDRQET